jgi:hypothetical protein
MHADVLLTFGDATRDKNGGVDVTTIERWYKLPLNPVM